MRRTLVGLAFLAAVAGCGPMVFTGTGTPAAPRIRTGDHLISAMHNRYDGRWYRTVTFVQKSTYYRADGSVLRAETWYEAGQFPGKLRIDMGEPSRQSGILYRADSVYQLQSGRITDKRVDNNELLTLGFDVYTQPQYRSADQLRRKGFNLSVLRTDSLDGRRVYVVGAAKGDSITNQFWIDAERLLFVRALMTQSGRTRDVRFERYTQYGGGWVAEEVRVLSGGRMAFHEEYSQVRVNDPLDDNLFVPERWSTATHWRRP